MNQISDECFSAALKLIDDAMRNPWIVIEPLPQQTKGSFKFLPNWRAAFRSQPE